MRSRLLFLATLLAAQSASAEETRQLGAHEHGVGALDIAFESGQIAMAFKAPGADIVGFEHPAESDADKAAIEAALAVLADPLALFTLPDAAGCTVTEASAELESAEDGHDEHGEHEEHGEHDDHDEHGEEHDDHDEEHADHEHGHDDHGEEHDEHDHAEASHTEFHAEYLIACTAPEAIDAIGFAYFEAFANAREVEVQLVSAKGAFAAEVTRDEPRLAVEDML